MVLNIFITDLLSRNEICATEYYNRFLKDCKSKDLRTTATKMHLEHTRSLESGYEIGVEFISTDNQPPMEVLSKFENKVVYLDFWASWCSPCLRSIPLTKELSKSYLQKDVEVIYVGHNDQRSSLENAIKDHNILGKHFILNEQESEIWRKEFEISSIPSYVLLDRNKKIVELDAPHPDNKLVYEMIDSLLLEK